MSDKLEDFIRENRHAFDDKEVPQGTWNKIEKSIPKLSSRPWFDSLLLWRAAAVLFMGLSIYLLIPKGSGVSESSRMAVREFNDVEEFYTSQISQKAALIEEISEGESDQFSQDFQQLEAMYMVLKEEWKARPSKKVKEALVLNLLVRMNLLNQQLHRLEEDSDEAGEAAKSAV